jgi:hypothetical protein
LRYNTKMMLRFLESRSSVPWLVGFALLGAALFVFALSTLMLPYSQIVEEASNEDLTCLQIPFTQARAAEIIESYDREAREAARALHLPGDLIFPVGYALLYSSLIGLIARRQKGRWLRWGVVAMLFPFLAMILDWTENAFIVRMLDISLSESTAAIPAWMPLAGGLAGSLKYLFLSLLTPLYGLGAIIHSLIRGERPLTWGPLLTYGIAGALLLFNVAQTVTQVPGCLAQTF